MRCRAAIAPTARSWTRCARSASPAPSPHDPAHLAGVDELVVSSALDADEPELVRARELGIPIRHRSEALAAVLAEHRRRDRRHRGARQDHDQRDAGGRADGARASPDVPRRRRGIAARHQRRGRRRRPLPWRRATSPTGRSRGCRRHRRGAERRPRPPRPLRVRRRRDELLGVVDGAAAGGRRAGGGRRRRACRRRARSGSGSGRGRGCARSTSASSPRASRSGRRAGRRRSACWCPGPTTRRTPVRPRCVLEALRLRAGRGVRGARDVPRRRPPVRAGRRTGRDPRDRRLRAPPGRAGGDARRGPGTVPGGAAGRLLPAAHAVADPAVRRRVRGGAGRAPTWWCCPRRTWRAGGRIPMPRRP